MSWRPERTRGHQRAYLPQDITGGGGPKVMEVVLLGRLRRLGWRVADEDLQVVESVLRQLGILGLQPGGLDAQRWPAQLVFLAQALAAEPDVLLLDEPTSARWT